MQLHLIRTNTLPMVIAPKVQLPEDLADAFPMTIGKNGKITAEQHAVLVAMADENAKLGQDGLSWSVIIDALFAVDKMSAFAKMDVVDAWCADGKDRTVMLDRATYVAKATGQVATLPYIPGRQSNGKRTVKPVDARRSARSRISSWIENRLGDDFYAAVFPLVEA